MENKNNENHGQSFIEFASQDAFSASFNVKYAIHVMAAKKVWEREREKRLQTNKSEGKKKILGGPPPDQRNTICKV